jgi:hypothetical protein
MTATPLALSHSRNVRERQASRRRASSGARRPAEPVSILRRVPASCHFSESELPSKKGARESTTSRFRARVHAWDSVGRQ